jgi:hypothetical protein
MDEKRKGAERDWVHGDAMDASTHSGSTHMRGISLALDSHVPQVPERIRAARTPHPGSSSSVRPRREARRSSRSLRSPRRL